MTKKEFLSTLQDKLSNLPRKDTAERISFYEEMINDRMEEGLSEEEAIADIGTVDEIYDQFVAELPLIKIITNKLTPKKRLSGGKIAIIASTSIVWFPLLISFFAIMLSLYAVLCSVAISVWAVFISLAASAPAGIVCGIAGIFGGNICQGLMFIGLGLILAGIAIFAFYGSLYMTKGSIALTKKTVIGIKNLIVK